MSLRVEKQRPGGRRIHYDTVRQVSAWRASTCTRQGRHAGLWVGSGVRRPGRPTWGSQASVSPPPRWGRAHSVDFRGVQTGRGPGRNGHVY